MELVDQREEARWLWSHYLVSARRVCGLLLLGESSYRYVSRRNDEPLKLALQKAAQQKPRWGYRRLRIRLGEGGMRVNHKRVYRVYREAGWRCGARRGNACCERVLCGLQSPSRTRSGRWISCTMQRQAEESSGC